ncbi:MAG: transglycosylase domain-containing protein [Patescibacteria group bacterium]
MTLFNMLKLKKFLPHPQSSIYKKIGFWSLTGLIGLGCLALISFASIIAILSIGLPDVSKLENITAAQSTEIFDREGKLLYTIHGEENREYVPISKISKTVMNATVAIEDDDFWNHAGFDIWALGRVGLYEVFGIGSPRGGSTITQQYIKNTFLSAERSYTRKAKELILAIRLERAYTKEEILELYLNRIPYGNNAYGVQKASEIYFNKNANELTLAESACLAALPQAPSRYNPFGDNKYSHLLKEFTADELHYREIESEFDLELEEYSRGLIGKHVKLANGKDIYIAGRTDSILKRMDELEYITPEERQKALNDLQNLQFNTYVEDIQHPHFVLYVKQLLEEKYGKDVVEQGGLKVYTTIDSNLQTYAEQVVTDQGEINDKTYGVNNAAVLTINAKTGEILVMIGSRKYSNEEIDGNVNVVLRPRQPGSSFKPIVYAGAFYNGYGPGSVIEDVPTRIGNDRPQNYAGNWLGQITIRKALGQSRNIPAIKAYYLAGEQKAIIELSKKMGINALNDSHDYGYPLAIGAGEIPLIEMVTAYGTFANNGKKPELTSILKVENANGDILEEWTAKEFDEVLDPQIAFMINDILSDRAVGIGPRMYVDGKTNAAKTGTSTKENKKAAGTSQVRPSDGWTIGYTPTIVTGVWTGNTDGTGLGFNADGYNNAAPIFKKVMAKALEKLPDEKFPEPEGIKRVTISRASGKLPGASTPDEMKITEIFPSFSVPTEVENLFFKVKIDKVSGLLATEFTPEDAVINATFQNYEPIKDLFNWRAELIAYYESKAAASGETPTGVYPGLPPTEKDNVHTAESINNKPEIQIISPSSNSFLNEGNFEVQVSIDADNGISTVEFYINNDKKYFTAAAPYTGYLRLQNPKIGATYKITAKVIDALGYSSSSNIEVKAGDGNTNTSGNSDNNSNDNN